MLRTDGFEAFAAIEYFFASVFDNQVRGEIEWLKTFRRSSGAGPR
jgi:hypothetical protein